MGQGKGGVDARRILACLLIAGVVVPATVAHAAPANDDLASAQRIAGAESLTATNAGATKEPGEPDHGGDPGGASIWFSYTAPGTGNVVLDTEGSDFDTLLGVYLGSDVGSLSMVASGDDKPDVGSLAARAALQVEEGKTYRIAVDGKAGVTGNVTLVLETSLPTCHVIGTSAPDVLVGTVAGETLCGLGGDDVIRAAEGRDVIYGGDGDDRLVGGGDDDRLFGDAGRDTVDGSEAPGPTQVDLESGISTGDGRDTLFAIEHIIGSPFADVLGGDRKNNRIAGDRGDDVIDGRGGDDNLLGEGGADSFTPGPGDDVVWGGDGRDLIFFSDAAAAVSVDLAFGRARGQGIDQVANVQDVTGSPKADTLRGTSQPNRITGGAGNDLLSGLAGNDNLSGGQGRDLIYTGDGRDRLSGGSGTDTCFPKACERRAAFDDWLPVVNLFRAAARLPRVMEQPDFSAADYKHARYVVKTDQPGHVEDPQNRWYSKEGALAGANSNVFWSTSTASSDRTAISFWMSGPFHAVGLLRPGLAEVGYGAFREASSVVYRMAAALNVLGGLEEPSSSIRYPIRFPGKGSTVPLTSFPGNEFPNPLTPCGGYSAPTGLPILLMLDQAQNIGKHSFKRASIPLQHCVYTGSSYRNPSEGDQALGRAVLGSTVVLIPRAPLVRGARYSVSIHAGGKKFAWSFSVGV